MGQLRDVGVKSSDPDSILFATGALRILDRGVVFGNRVVGRGEDGVIAAMRAGASHCGGIHCGA